MVDKINLTSDLGMERIRSRGDRSGRSDRRGEEQEEVEGVKSMLATLFRTCVDDVLLDDEEELSAFGNRSEQFSDYLITKSMLKMHFYRFAHVQFLLLKVRKEKRAIEGSL